MVKLNRTAPEFNSAPSKAIAPIAASTATLNSRIGNPTDEEEPEDEGDIEDTEIEIG